MKLFNVLFSFLYFSKIIVDEIFCVLCGTFEAKRHPLLSEMRNLNSLIDITLL